MWWQRVSFLTIRMVLNHITVKHVLSASLNKTFPSFLPPIPLHSIYRLNHTLTLNTTITVTLSLNHDPKPDPNLKSDSNPDPNCNTGGYFTKLWWQFDFYDMCTAAASDTVVDMSYCTSHVCDSWCNREQEINTVHYTTLHYTTHRRVYSVLP